jgi:hypothetical protein
MRFLLIILLVTISAAVSAAEKPYYSVGFTPKDQHAFKNDIWAALPMKKFQHLTDEMSLNLSKIERSVFRNLLTAEAAAPISPKESQEKDYLALRIQKLIELGYPQDAVTLYQIAQKHDLPEEVHKLGVLAGFFSNKGDLACLDYRIALQKEQLEAWKDADELCALIDSDFEDSAKKTISISNFNKLSFEKKAVLFPHRTITLKTREKLSLKDKLEPLTLLFIAQKGDNNPSLYYRTKLLLEDYGLKSAAFELKDVKEAPDFKLYKQRQQILDNQADKEDRANSFKALLKQRMSLPAAFFEPLMQKNYAKELDVTLNPSQVFDLAAIAEELNTESPYKNANLKADPTLPFTLLKNKSAIDTQSLENWFNTFCFEDAAFNPSFCMNTYLLAENKLGKEFDREIKKQIYGKFFTLTSYVNYAIPNDDILGAYPAKPLNKNNGYNLLYGLRLGSDGVNTLSFPLFEVIMTLAEDDVLDEKTAHLLSIKNMVTLKETN